MKLRTLFFVALFLGSLGAVASESVGLTRQGGVYAAPVQINGALTLHFVLDTGAATVIIPADVALTLVRTGTIGPGDVLGAGKFVLADGSLVENTRINLRTLRIGSRVLTDVQAAVGGVESSLLLGQSALEQLEPWRLDTGAGHLVLFESGPTGSVASNVPAATPRRPALATAALAAGARQWQADWGHGIRATAHTGVCPIDEFATQGYSYTLAVDIPESRLKKAADAWGIANGRALTVQGCWFTKSDGLAHAKMRRKKDGKVWEQDLNFSDGSWTSSADAGIGAQ